MLEHTYGYLLYIYICDPLPVPCESNVSMISPRCYYSYLTLCNDSSSYSRNTSQIEASISNVNVLNDDIVR